MCISQSVSRLIVALSLIIAALTPMSRANSENTTPYPTEAIEGFTNTCTAQGSGQGVPTETMRQICTCSIEAFQKAYTYEQFMKIDSDLGSGKPTPPEMSEMVEDCVKEVTQK